ncbi:hypothetical protein MKW94_003952 [Papaver nudicaule]|uniref:Dienelactone hydrolase domain-containing protein n=1 Tax=Papaver nudicaule TaxID=74823 RepID=A0AA41RUD2_PAPNU|nr:hypothetical protein [Papaver nudicaule]
MARALVLLVLLVFVVDGIIAGGDHHHCCKNPPALNSTSGSGHVEEIGGLKAYVSGSLDSKLGILLVSDFFGYEAPNLRNLADKVAAAGYYVVVPDFFHGDPYTPGEDVLVWLQSHGTDKGAADAKQVIKALKYKGISAVGAAGMCWGGKVVGELAKSDDLKVIVMMHPSRVTVEDIKEIKVPISILGAELDKQSPPALLKQFEEVLSTKPEVDSFVKIFEGVDHGWTLRYDIGNKEAVKQAEKAHHYMLKWLSKYVKC